MLRRFVAAGAAPLLASMLLTSVCAAEDAKPADKWKARVELSYVNTSGNTDTQTFAGKFSARKKGPVYRHFASGSLLQTVNEGDETADRIALNARTERTVTKRFFTLVTGGYLSDRFAGYDYRLFAGPGAGYDFIDTEKQSLSGLMTLLYNHDELSSGPVTKEDYWSLKATGNYRLQLFENTVFGEEASYSVSLRDSDRAFLDSVTSVEVKINSRVSLGVSYTVNYQQSPQGVGVKRTDTTLLTTLIIDF